MGTTFNQGQMTQLGNNLNIAVATALPKVAAKFEPKPLLKALEGRGQFLADQLAQALEQIFNNMSVLAPRSSASVTFPELHDPNVFFQTRSGLWVSDSFRSLVVANAKPTEVGSVIDLSSVNLTRGPEDKDIETVLPVQHVWDDSLVCAAIATMITEQWGGKEGRLLNNGYANLFYTSSCVVNVDWNANDREWNVLTWERSGFGWRARLRVFSPATAA